MTDTTSHYIEALAKKAARQLLEMTAFPNVHFHYSDDAQTAQNAAALLLTLSQKNRELEQALAEAREALKPFADIANSLHKSWGDDAVLSFNSDMGVLYYTVSVGNLRRAARALNTHPDTMNAKEETA